MGHKASTWLCLRWPARGESRPETAWKQPATKTQLFRRIKHSVQILVMQERPKVQSLFELDRGFAAELPKQENPHGWQALANRITTVPVGQLVVQRLMVNVT